MHTILLLGSGALKIGEAGEFDYSGTQAIKALKEEGKRIILVNPNIATIQTSEGLADEIYYLPVTANFVEQVIQKEKPDGILLSFGGQTALNCGIALSKKGILKKYGVQILGTPIEAIIATEDRAKFSERLAKLHLPTARGKTATTLAQAKAFAKTLGFPVMVRSGFALGGTGSGIARTEEEFEQIVTSALAASPQIMVEESLHGWKELEYEVVRDANDNCITVCNMENFDPVGIHTGESIVVAPSQTLNSHEYYMLRKAAIDVIRELKIVGECNIQFALHPKSLEFRIIEVNARLSRSSALASKATGYPLAYVAAKLALGKTLPELPNSITKTTTAFFEPALDYVVVKIPRWDLEKFTFVTRSIGSEMKSVGEVMAIGRTFEEAIQKGARMLNDGYEGVIDKRFSSDSKRTILKKLTKPDSMRLFTVCSALRAGISVKKLQKQTAIDPWFLGKLQNIVHVYQELHALRLSQSLLERAKKYGFSDRQIADIRGVKELSVRAKRKAWGIVPVIKRIDTMAGEFPAITNYLYCTYNASVSDYIPKTKEQKIMVLGCGPYAIGTSVEFDWCGVTTSLTLRKRGMKSIIVNCNPETVSTDYDMSDYLYFEELTLERVLDIYDVEKSPAIVSVGGQIPNNLAPKLHAAGIRLLGTGAHTIYQAEHRQTFSKLLDTLRIAQPDWSQVHTAKQALTFAEKVGFPLLVRPSFVLSGKGMSVLYSKAELQEYLRFLGERFSDFQLVISKYLTDTQECDVDGVAQNGKILLWAISEHVEGGGVHSGDSTLLLPTVSLKDKVQQLILDQVARIVKELGVNGPFNIQFLIQADMPYVIECNLRASRSFPFVSKVLGVNFIEYATDVALGHKIPHHVVKKPLFQAVKVPQFSFHKLRQSDPILKVEMNSTGEVCALGTDEFDAYCKAILATGVTYPTKKTAFVSLGGAKGKLAVLRSCLELVKHGYSLYATHGTALFLQESGVHCKAMSKIYEGKGETALTLIKRKLIDFAIVIPEEQNVHHDLVDKGLTDGYIMRRAAIDAGIPVFTTAQTANLFVSSVLSHSPISVDVRSIAQYRQNKRPHLQRSHGMGL